MLITIKPGRTPIIANPINPDSCSRERDVLKLFLMFFCEVIDFYYLTWLRMIKMFPKLCHFNWLYRHNAVQFFKIQSQMHLTLALIATLALLSLSRTDSFQLSAEEAIRSVVPQIADTVYHGGTILTMEDRARYPDFVAVKDAKIIKTGSLSEMNLHVGPRTKLINLRGKTLLPGFIDPHAHFGNTAVLLNQPVNIKSPPFGPIKTMKELLETVRNYIKEHKISEGEKVYVEGYSDIDLAENRHPTRFELDWISTAHPIFLRHFSEHAYAANSMGLERIGYTELTPNPSGGFIDRYQNGTLTGVLRELAVLPIIERYSSTIEHLNYGQIKKAAQLFFSVGVTTAQDIPFTMGESKAYKQLGDNLPIDVSSYVWVNQNDLTAYYETLNHMSTSRYKVKGIKIILDGSIQTYTALLSQPYWVPFSQTNDNLDNYTYDASRSCQTQACGIDYFPDKEVLRELMLECYLNEIDVLAHCNGDKAADNLLDALAWARRQTSVKKDTRFIIIHSQTLREDQLDTMAELNVHPSFFTPHIYFWGDLHEKTFLGPERAKHMNPVKSAIQRKLIYTLHNDSPAVMTGQMEGMNTFLTIIESSITRKTKQGKILGAEQRISPYEALKGITINAAWQSNMEKTAGSIATGKVADFVILSENPLSCMTDISSMQILATIKEDELVYGEYPKWRNGHFIRLEEQ